MSNGKNVHRAIALSRDNKVEFKYQQGLTGQQTYIIELSDKPVSLYRGGTEQFVATSPAVNSIPAMLNPRGYNKLDINSSAVKSYSQYLTNKQDNILSEIAAVASNNLDIIKSFYPCI